MFAIGEPVEVQDVLETGDVAIVTSEPESDIVRDYTLDELFHTRQSHPEALGAYAHLSMEEIRDELQRYEGFLVKVEDGDTGWSSGCPETGPARTSCRPSFTALSLNPPQGMRSNGPSDTRLRDRLKTACGTARPAVPAVAHSRIAVGYSRICDGRPRVALRLFTRKATRF